MRKRCLPSSTPSIYGTTVTQEQRDYCQYLVVLMLLRVVIEFGFLSCGFMLHIDRTRTVVVVVLF